VAAAQSGTWNITNVSGTVSLPTGAATAALQTQPGVDIGDVTVNNAAGAAAVNVQDGGNSLTVDGTVTANLAAGTNNIGDIDVLTVPAPLSTTGGGTEATALRVTVASDSTGVLSVDDNGGALTVDNGGTFAVQPRPETANGLTIFRSIDLDETEEEVKGTAGQIYAVWFSNVSSGTRYLKLYNATAANVTVGTTTPVITLALPGNASDAISGVFSSTMGIAFDTAISAAATTGILDSDTGAPGTNEVIVNIFYK
jgi:hypothetical protein